MTLTSATHPNLFAAFLLIEYDNGMINRTRPEPTQYNVPINFEDNANVAEKELSQLSAEQLSTMCTGDEEEQDNLITSYSLHRAHSLLSEFFESSGWSE